MIIINSVALAWVVARCLKSNVRLRLRLCFVA